MNHLGRAALALWAVHAGAAVTPAQGSPADQPTVQYRSPAGVAYYSLVDTGAVARARSALAAEPRSVERIIAARRRPIRRPPVPRGDRDVHARLGVAPNDPMLYRWRGHRYLSVRDLDRAMADLTRGFQLDSTNYGILYHLGIVRFARGDFAGAADAFARAQRRAPDAAELAGATDWLWMSLARAGRAAEAQAMLDRRPDSLPVANAYTQRLKLYRGQVVPDSVFTPADTADVQVATLELRDRKLVPGPGRHGSRPPVVRALGGLGGLAGVRLHRLGDRAAPVATLTAARIARRTG